MAGMKPETKLKRAAITMHNTFDVDPRNIIIDDSLNGRMRPASDESVKEMAQSMLENGQQSPAWVRYNDNGELVLVYGFRRAKAARLINNERMHPGPGIFPLRVELRYFDSDVDALKRNIVENTEREETTALDDAYNIKRLKAAKVKMADIQRIYGGKSRTWIYDMLSLTKLPEEIQDRIAEGVLSPTAGLRLADLKGEARKEMERRVLAGESVAVDDIFSAAREAEAAEIEAAGDEDEDEPEDGDEEAMDTEDEGGSESEDDSESSDAPGKPKRKAGKKKAAKKKGRKKAPKKQGRAATLKQVRKVIEVLAEQQHPQLAAMGSILLKFVEGRLTEQGVITKLKKYGRENPGGLLDGAEFEDDDGQDEGGEE